MEDNPFSVLVGEIKNMSRDQIPVVFRVGRVVSAYPLRVETGGIVLEASEIFVNEFLIKGAERKINFGDISGNLQINGEAASVTGQAHGTFTAQDMGLSAGDRVILLTEADSTFYLLCKVVML